MSIRLKSKFAPSQEANQQRRESLIVSFLLYLENTRVKFPNVTALADMVAKHITLVEGKSCNRATFLRNPRYSSKLHTFQAKKLGPGLGHLSPSNIKDPTARVLLMASELETGNVNRELERLKIYVQSLEEQLDKTNSPPLLADSSAIVPQDIKMLADHEFRFIRTCQAMRSLISFLGIIIEVDLAKKQILDRTRRRDNVIVNEDVAAPFCEWLATLPTVAE